MPRTHNCRYPDRHQRLVNYYKALAHCARTTIVELILEEEWLTCTDINRRLKSSRSTTSYHINQLLKAGIIAKAINHNIQGYVMHPTYYHDMRKSIVSFCKAA